MNKMKTGYLYIVVFILTFPLSIYAQTVKIPDANFKRALIAIGIDTNGDGEIQLTEAKAVTRLYVDKANITSLVGIKSFTNLNEFGFYDNNIKELDLSGMTSIRAIYGFNNQTEVANLKGMTGLETLFMQNNSFRWLDISGLKKLREIKLYDNNLAKLEAINLPELEIIEAQHNRISEFKVVGTVALKEVNLTENMLTSLDFTSCKKMEEIYVYKNPVLSLLEIRGLRMLKKVSCGDTMLTNVNMSGTVSLVDFSW